MKKELEVKSAQAVAVTSDISEWGDTPVMGQDIVIAKILPMQPTSVLVGDSKAAIGEFRDSLSGEPMGSIVEPMDIIPFHVEKFWDIQVKEGDQYEWDHSIPLIENPADKGYNDNLEWTETVNGQELKRIRRLNFYVMIPSQIAAGTSVPFIFSFKSTSIKEGKKIYSQMFLRNRKANLPPPAYTFKVGGRKEKNDKGTFIIPTVELGRASTKAEIDECLSWYKLIKKGAVKVDDSDLKQADATDIMMDAQGEDTGTGAF